MLQHVRPRAHHAHLAPEHVNELRHLVQVGLAQQATYTCQPRIVAAGLLRMRLTVHPHAAEFDTLELLVVLARAGLPEEDGTFRFQLDQQAYQRHQPGQHQQQHQAAEGDVEDALAYAVAPIIQRLAARAQHGDIIQVIHMESAVHHIAHIGHHAEADAKLLRLLHHAVEAQVLLGGDGAVDLLHPIGFGGLNGMRHGAQDGVVRQFAHILFFLAKAHHFGMVILFLKGCGQSFGRFVEADDHYLAGKVAAMVKMLADAQVDEAVHQQQHALAGQHQEDVEARKLELAGKEQVHHHHGHPENKDAHGAAGKEFKGGDVLFLVQQGEVGHQHPGNVQPHPEADIANHLAALCALQQ